MEGELPNGLIVGHAYSVTDARTVCINVLTMFFFKSVIICLKYVKKCSLL